MPSSDYREMLGIVKPSEMSEMSVNDLSTLALFMTNTTKFLGGIDTVLMESSRTVSEPKVSSGYTYLGQFIVHDISFDSMSERLENPPPPWEKIAPEKIKNLRNPIFDLETIYGNKELPDDSLMQNGSLTLLKLGETRVLSPVGQPPSVRKTYPNDLPRNEQAIATIVDKRNDENLLVAQTQVAFMKFHNAIVYKLGNSNTIATFNEARKIAIRYYQRIILTDFLPKIVKDTVLKEVIAEVKNGKNKFYNFSTEDKFIPLEFSVAAYRTGHSMIRSAYNLNSVVREKEASLGDLMMLTGQGRGLTKNLPSRWLINWKLFYNIDNSISLNNEFNFANPLTTQLSRKLNVLKPFATASIANSLSALDLFRGRALGLHSGQDVARIIADQTDAKVLIAEDIEKVFYQRIDAEENVFTEQDLYILSQKFKDRTPLWFYLLAEAEIQTNGVTLGDVGSRILAETIVKLLYETPNSILAEGNNSESNVDFLVKDNDAEKTFSMPEMLKFISETHSEYFKEIYPGRDDFFDEINPIG